MPDNPKSQGAKFNSRIRWARRLCRYVSLILIPYVLFVAMMAFLQRSFIYLPTREAQIEPQDAALPAGQVHAISVETDDGLQLHGWHVLADGRTAANQEECDRELVSGRPLVLFFSGNAANRRYRVPEIQVLTGAGANIFIFDYRGYGENAGSPTEELLAADAQRVWEYATAERNVPHRHILFYGESLGGGVAVRLAAELCATGTPPGGLILRSTFSSLVDAGAYHYPWLPVRLFLVDRYLSIDRISAVTCPILQIHGVRDRIMPLKLGRRLFDAAPDHSADGIPKQFIELPTAAHNDVILMADAELRRAVARFFETLKLKQ